MTLRPRILVVAEERHARRFLEVTLHARGYLPEFVADAKEAVAAARRGFPSLVLVDMTLPGGEGVRVLERFQLEPLSRIPVLALVGAGHAGADTTEPELAEAIRTALAEQPVAVAAA